ncbi:MAG: putative membrane protein YecN with MAPEG domain [Gammaproteobacteria bacterium]|jgi:uncharacterized membrane protein YecN with MAPEG domain
MGSFPITTLYAGILGLLLMVLTARVIKVVRIKGGVSRGDGGNPEFFEIIRGQGNFVEFVPITLVLIALTEASGNPSWLIHTLGAALVAARIAHPLGLKAANKPTALRFLGAVGTFLIVIVASTACILASF